MLHNKSTAILLNPNPDSILILIQILSHLPYQSLVKCQQVCNHWRNVITSSAVLKTNLFRQPPTLAPSNRIHPITLHPLLSKTKFFAGEKLEDIEVTGDNGSRFLVKLMASREFATTPAIEKLSIRIVALSIFIDEIIEISNQEGVCIMDIFRELVEFPFPNVLFPTPKNNRLFSVDYSYSFYNRQKNVSGDSVIEDGVLEAHLKKLALSDKNAGEQDVFKGKWDVSGLDPTWGAKVEKDFEYCGDEDEDCDEEESGDEMEFLEDDQCGET
ncbi:hypothetical protein RUND412_006737 [Rhizina undulata]